MNLTRKLLCLVLALLAAACGEDPGDQAAAEELTLVLPGKEDNYLNLAGVEYSVTVDHYVELEEKYTSKSLDDRMKRALQLIDADCAALNFFLTRSLAEGRDLAFTTSVPGIDPEDMFIHPGTGNELRYYFTFQLELAGPKQLFGGSSSTWAGGVHKESFLFPRVSNSLLEKSGWYREKKWTDLDPDQLTDEELAEVGDFLTATIRPLPSSVDGWLDYEQLTADKKIDVAYHLGWSDDSGLKTLKDAEFLYNWLVEVLHFSSPVSSFDKYRRLSGPLTRTCMIGGEKVSIRVSLYWGTPGTATDPAKMIGAALLRQDLVDSLKSREVIIFDVHSQPYTGLCMGSGTAGTDACLSEEDIPKLTMSKGYQLIFVSGARSYGLGQVFASNPNKQKVGSLDVISNLTDSAEGANGWTLISALMGHPTWGRPGDKSFYQDNRFYFWRFGQILATAGAEAEQGVGSFGVHGIDDNPRVTPYSDPVEFCKSCDTDAQCYAEGNFCVSLSINERICTAECTDDAGCPLGFVCAPAARGDRLETRICVPRSLTCGILEDDPRYVGVIFNEVLPAPSTDANRDGIKSSHDDEFIELVNWRPNSIDLSGAWIRDGSGPRFTFPDGFILNPGKAVVIFGGPKPSKPFDFLGEYGVKAFYAGNLGLNNTGDTLTLLRRDGSFMDAIEYGLDGGQGTNPFEKIFNAVTNAWDSMSGSSLVREEDGSALSVFVVHPGPEKCSPGLRSNGELF